MIMIDKALEKLQASGRPIRVGMVGCGFMGKGIALQICNYTPGMELVAIANRNVNRARNVYHQAGIDNIREAESVSRLEDTIKNGVHAITGDPFLLCEADNIDAIIEATGAVEYSARVVFRAIQHRKHVILMNAELDGTIGPFLKAYADKEGVIYTNSDGDQPGVIMNLYRFVKGIGVTPVLCGNIKGLHDPYRNPTTQAGFAAKWGQNPNMVTSFADGTKISFEQAIVANATGMGVGRRGMFGPAMPTGTPIEKAAGFFPEEALCREGGIVDYVVGAVPSPGVFVLGTHDHPLQKHYLNLYKLGEGPFYCFYRPYHLCHFEVPNSVARAVLFRDATIAPLNRPFVDVVTTAKTDLKTGDIIDDLGGYKTYGLCENSDTVREENLLPIGLAEGCGLKTDVAKDQVITFEDVELPKGRLSYQLWEEQNKYFNLVVPESQIL